MTFVKPGFESSFPALLFCPEYLSGLRLEGSYLLDYELNSSHKQWDILVLAYGGVSEWFRVRPCSEVTR